jgi:hypothetical protein
MEFDRDFREFVASFIAHDVRFLIVGGYALAAHGLPRATGDLDAWVWVGGDNAQRILSALEEFGFGGLGLAAADFERPGHVIQLGYPPYRIDILTAIDGVQFEDAWDHRIDVSIGEATAPFIGRAELIANKRAANRPQDIADVERLTRADDQ